MGAVAIGFLLLIAIPPLEFLLVIVLGVVVATSSKPLRLITIRPRSMSRNVWILAGLFAAAFVYLLLAWSHR
jgi:hypothetical protein